MNVVATQHSLRGHLVLAFVAPVRICVLLLLVVAMCFSGTNLFAQVRVITGKVTEVGTNITIAGAKITAKGTRAGAFSKKDGTYSIAAPSDAKTLVIEYIGFKKKEVAIGSSDEINIQLNMDVLKLEELVVTAVGIEQKKANLGYSIQDVKQTDLTQSREVNIVQALAGKVAGVQIVGSSGSPGSSSFINIRGPISITGSNQPLFVVDGVPISNAGNSGNVAGVDQSNRAIDLNPEDIESMSVLKSASATVLYGTQAAGGAIIITTKKGKSGFFNVTFNSAFTVDNVNKLPEIQSTYSQGGAGRYQNPTTGQSLSWGGRTDSLRWVTPTAAEMANRANGRPGEGVYDSRGVLRGPIDSRYASGTAFTPFDNQKLFFQTATSWTNSVSISGGNELSAYYFSVGNTKQNGIIPTSTFERTTMRLNADMKLNNEFKISGSVGYTNSGGRRTQKGSNTSGVMLGLLRTPNTFDNTAGLGVDNRNAWYFPTSVNPVFPHRNYRGGYTSPSTPASGYYDNPLWTANENPYTDDVNRIMGSVELVYTPTWMQELTISYRFGADIFEERDKLIVAPGSADKKPGRVFEAESLDRIINSDLLFTFRKELTDDLKGILVLGQTLYGQYQRGFTATGDGLIVPEFYNLSNAVSTVVTQGVGNTRKFAILGKLGLEYKDMLYFNADFRHELSTTLPEANNAYQSYGANVGWVFTKLLGMEDNSFLPYGKLRASYAVVGNDAPRFATTTPFFQAATADGWTSGIQYPFLGTSGFQSSTVLGSNIITPEKISEMEVGTELKFLVGDQVINLDVAYFNKDSKNLILALPIAASSGYSNALKNVASINNKGIEVLLNANILKIDDFRADLTVNFSSYKNTVTQLAEGVETVFLAGFTGTSTRAVKGQPYMALYGKGFMRDASGNLMINNVPGDAYRGFPVSDPQEKYLGSFLPDWSGGIRLSLSYKDVGVTALLDTRQGGKMWNGTKSALYYFGTAKETESRGSSKVYTGVTATKDANGNWVSSGQANTQSVVVGANWFRDGQGNGFVGDNAEDFIEDASWTRLRELTVTYRLPTEWLSGSFVKSVQISATGRNLWLKTQYTGVDPETSLTGAGNGQGLDYFNNPNTKGYTFNIRIGL